MAGAAVGASCAVGAITISLPATTTVTRNTTTPAAATAGIVVNTNGQYQRVSGTTTNIQAWITPTTLAPGAYECRFTVTSGTVSSGSATSTWLAISTSPNWNRTQAGGSIGSSTVTGTLEIRNGAGVVQATSSVTLTAEVTP